MQYRVFGIFMGAFALCISCTHRSLPPNVVLFTYDTVRADRIGCYGYERGNTPTLDRFASEGVLFERAYCQSPLTLPSHASILTGRFPQSHGIRLNGAYRLPNGIPTLAEVLREHGYLTAAFVSAVVLDSQYGLQRGFDVYDDQIEVEDAKTFQSGIERSAGETAARVREWLNDRPGEPFFLWIHFFDPHAEYEPPEPFRSRFKDEPYDGEIAYADSMAGVVIDLLEERGILSRSLIVATSDHGEGLGDHEEGTHGIFIYDSTIHVPLIFRLPYDRRLIFETWSPGARIQAPVQMVDIVPTILAILGIRNDGVTDGRNLFTEQISQAKDLYAETLLPHAYGWASLISIRSNSWKYIHAPRAELYNIHDDEGELVNVIESRDSTASELENRLQSLYAKTAGTAAHAADISPDDKDALRALGYVVDYIDAGSVWDDDSRADPKDRISVISAYYKARELVNEGYTDSALHVLLPLLEYDNLSPILHHTIGLAYLEGGNYEAGITYLTRFGELSENPAEAFYYMGIAHYQNGNLSAAIDAFRSCIEYLPTYAAAWDRLAAAYGHSGDMQSALESHDKAVSLDPSNPEYRRNRAVTLLGVKRLVEAERDIRDAIGQRSDNPDYRFQLALIQIEQRRFEAALDELRAILTEHPDHLGAQQRLIETEYHLGNRERADSVAQKLLVLIPEDPLANFYHGRFLLETGRAKEAVTSLEYAVVGMPTFQTAYLLLGNALVRVDAPVDQKLRFISQAADHGIKLPRELEAALRGS